MLDKKTKSMNNVEKRKRELNKISKLPPRMQEAEERNKKKAKDDSALQFKFVPEINYDVPNFDKLHEQFENKMEKMKSQKEKVYGHDFKMMKR
jgi:hypothetical protein